MELILLIVGSFIIILIYLMFDNEKMDEIISILNMTHTNQLNNDNSTKFSLNESKNNSAYCNKKYKYKYNVYIKKITVWDFMKQANIKENQEFIFTLIRISGSIIQLGVKGKQYCIHYPKSLHEDTNQEFKDYKAHTEFINKHYRTGTPTYKIIINEN